jgi:hypothetical protein
MCVGGLCLGCRELHAGKLHTRPQRAGQAEGELFLAADHVFAPVVEATGVSLSTAGGAHAYADSNDTCADAAASRARAYMTEGRTVWWSRYGWRR